LRPLSGKGDFRARRPFAIWRSGRPPLPSDRADRSRAGEPLETFTPASIPDVVLIAPRVFEDGRGFFMETFQERRFAAAGIRGPFVQDNHSRSARGTVRGLHYQIRQPQGKLLRVIAGEIWDVAVDLRRSSQTFGRWTANVLSSANRLELWVPVGFAHGFLVTSPHAEIVYKTTDFYAPDAERSLLWNDPELGIPWPLTPGDEPILSPRDAVGRPLREAEVFT
jgi:dTDP-4-dehydrorhamnose 3,5-epimerase